MVPKTYNLFREYGQFMVEGLTTHTNMYVDADKKRADHNSEMLTTCILTSVSPGTWAEIHAIYGNFKNGGMVYGKLVFKGLMHKAISDNNQKTRYLQDQ